MSQVKAEIRKLKDFMPARLNPNAGNEHSVPMIVDSIQSNGAGRPMLADKDGEMIAGSHSLQAFIDAGFEDAIVITGNGKQPIIYIREDIDIEDPRGRSLQIGDNRIGQKSFTPDNELLAAILGDIAAQDERLVKAAGYSDGELAELLALLSDEPPGDPGAAIDRAEELQAKWQVERGQLWQIGNHRLLCGDSTNADDVARVMAGSSIEMIWTDPPYGVAIGDKNKMLNAIARSNRVEENLANDTLDESGLLNMLSVSFDCAIAHCEAGAAWYVAAPAGPLHIIFGQVLNERGIWRQTIQWVKNNATFSPMGVDYHWRAEPIFYGWLPNAGHRYYGGRKQDTVWEIDRPVKSPEHPTMKPVELVSRAVGNSSLPSQVVYDPFLGSGTTLVACEQLGRKGRGLEIEPKYCAVILERMAGMGPTPELVSEI